MLKVVFHYVITELIYWDVTSACFTVCLLEQDNNLHPTENFGLCFS